jgi:DNA-binding MarR family transcriptional regulator
MTERKMSTFDSQTEALLQVLRQVMTRNQALGLEVIRRSVEPIDSLELQAIRIIGEHGSVRMRALVEGLGIAPSSATNLVDRLISKGIVRRSANEADRRIVQVSLDRQGKKIFKDTLDEQLKLCREMLNSFSPEERTRLINLLSRLGSAGQPDQEVPQPKSKASNHASPSSRSR